jgi:uncharacterized protein with PQ loop repeat
VGIAHPIQKVIKGGIMEAKAILQKFAEEKKSQIEVLIQRKKNSRQNSLLRFIIQFIITMIFFVIGIAIDASLHQNYAKPNTTSIPWISITLVVLSFILNSKLPYQKNKFIENIDKERQIHQSI